MSLVAKWLDGSRPHCVRWGSSFPAPSKRGTAAPHFSTHVYCGQMSGWIKMPLGMDVDLGPLFVRVWQNMSVLGVWPIYTYSPNFVNFGPGCPMIPCSNMHQSVTDALVRWFFNNFPMFADGFSVFYSVHCPRIRCKPSVQVHCIAQ